LLSRRRPALPQDRGHRAGPRHLQEDRRGARRQDRAGDPPRRRQHVPRDPAGGVTHMARVLVIEDDRAIALGLRLNLRREGHEVVLAHDGEAGFAEAQKPGVDLVVLDVMLPGRNGYELLKELRRRGADVPVLMLTAKGMEGDKILGLKLGADDYLAKPFGLGELLARVEALLRRRPP